jgi:hypothetical protein
MTDAEGVASGGNLFLDSGFEVISPGVPLQAIAPLTCQPQPLGGAPPP